MKGDEVPRILATALTSIVGHGRFIPEETAWVTKRINGLLDLVSGRDAVEKKRLSCPCLQSNPFPP